jgi:hypothetical protein
MINTTGLTHPALGKITRITPIRHAWRLDHAFMPLHADRPVRGGRPAPLAQRRPVRLAAVLPGGFLSRWRLGGLQDEEQEAQEGPRGLVRDVVGE